MSNVAYLPIEADRYGACVRQIYIRGLDLTGIAMRAQVRSAGDTPGAPLVDLQKVTNGNAEGLRLVGVETVAGLPISHVELVINETTLEALPYAGELGSATQLRWDWQVTLGGRKQRVARGEFTITGDGITGADYAPMDRPPGWSNAYSAAGGMRSGATLTFGDETATIAIDGADLLAPLAVKAQQTLDRINEFTTGPAGPAANTRLNLAALKAAAITDLASQWDGSTWFWAPGNFDGQADDIRIVKANSTALTVGAWVRGTDPADTRVSLFRFIPRNLWPAITGRTVNNTIADAQALTVYIRNAISFCAATRRRLFIPAGLYNIAPVGTFAAEGGACAICFPILSYMDLDAEAGASFRIVDGVSTDAAPLFMCMFGTNGQLTDVSWRGLVMDMNGQKNPISPNRASHVFSFFNQAMIFVSGTPNGNAALISNVHIDRCAFINCPGASCLVMAQSNSRDVKLGKGWAVRDCVFLEGGLDSHDHSAGYGWAEDLTVDACRFENSTQIGDYGIGGNVAFEIHGRNTKFTNCTVRRFYQGLWIDANLSAAVDDIYVAGNSFYEMKMRGVETFGLNPVSIQPYKVQIKNNYIEFDNNTHIGVSVKIGIGILSPYAMNDFDIEGNRIRPSGVAVASAGVFVSAGNVAGQKHNNIMIRNNRMEYTSLGVAVATNPTAGLGSIFVHGNTSYNLTPAGSVGVPQGVSYGANTLPAALLSIKDNTCIDDRSSPLCAFGVRAEGPCGALELWGNTASGMTSSDYEEANFTASGRKGMFPRKAGYTPPSLVNNSSDTQSVSIPNAVLGDRLDVAFTQDLKGLDLTAWISGAGTGKIKLANRTGADSASLGSGELRFIHETRH